MGEFGRVVDGLGGDSHGSGDYHLVISFFSVFFGFIGSVLRLDCKESGGIMFFVISGHLLATVTSLRPRFRKFEICRWSFCFGRFGVLELYPDKRAK